jgi:hypothetical protein
VAEAPPAAGAAGPLPGPLPSTRPSGQRNLDQQPARISISKWIEHDCDFVSSLYVLELPSTLHENAGAAHFDAPVLHPSALLRHIDLDVGMRIGPLKHSHRTRQSDSLASVKHGKGVVCRYHAESRPENDQQDNSPFFCARRLSHVYIPFSAGIGWNDRCSVYRASSPVP